MVARPQVRLEIVQAADATRFLGDSTAVQEQQATRQRRAALFEAALLQPVGQSTALGEQVALLWVLQKGYLDTVRPEDFLVRSTVCSRPQLCHSGIRGPHARVWVCRICGRSCG